MEPVRFTAEIRYWKPEGGGGLAVVDVPSAHVAAIGGLRQQKVRGRVNGAAFSSNVMPAGGGPPGDDGEQSDDERGRRGGWRSGGLRDRGGRIGCLMTPSALDGAW